MQHNDHTEFDSQLEHIRTTRESTTQNTNALTPSDTQTSLESNSVTKSNALARSYCRYTLNEKRLLECLISKLNPLRSDNPEFIRVSAVEYASTYDLALKNSYSQLSVASKGLIRRLVTLHIPSTKTPSKPDILEIPIMQQGFYSEGSGYVEFTFNPVILPHLILLKNKFSTYTLKNAKSFKSSYTWRLYEFLVSWSNSKKFISGSISNYDLDEFKLSLGVPDSYRFGMFEKSCLMVAVNELKKSLKIDITYELHKTSRKYTSISIKFEQSDQLDLPV